MAVTPSDLRAIPLFQGITDEHLQALMNIFERQHLAEGDVLFQAGDAPKHFIVLVEGEVALKEGPEIRFRLRPLAPIGELGALTGLVRNTTAVATMPSEIWRIRIPALMKFFEEHGEVAFPFYHNLLQVVADKVRRDERRLQEMRANIVRTQKSMKRVRDLVLETEDTVISKPVYDTLEDLIEHNRRWHYLVEPAHTLSAQVRLDDGSTVPVLEMSDGWMRLARSSAPGLNKGQDWSGVLILPGDEIPISGKVEGLENGTVLIQLDLLIRDYAAKLEDYLTRLHMLDFVV